MTDRLVSQRPASPWGKGGRRNFSPLHAMCSYLGAFPPRLAAYFIEELTDPGDIVLDPFAGRGTTHVEARVRNRRAVSSDLNPLAVALTSAKNTDVTRADALRRIDQHEQRFDLSLYLPEAQAQRSEIQLIYHPNTLAKLCYLRRMLNKGNDPVDTLLFGALLGIMHGAERIDGTSAYLSISMPNTFSMAPNYVRRFVQEHQLIRRERSVFDQLRQKVDRLFPNSPSRHGTGVVVRHDAQSLSHNARLSSALGQSSLVLTSPPYLGVVNYAAQNWIRLWLLEGDALDEILHLHDNLTIGPWLDFMEGVLGELKQFLAPDGAIVLVVGDVAKSGTTISPARELLRRLSFSEAFAYMGAISDYLDVQGKTTRLWKETRGKATTVDRVLILANDRPRFRVGSDEEGASIADTLETHASEFANLAAT